jgi:uncharacterized protein (DUF2062 family)
MTEQLASILFIHAALFIAALGYAKFLNQDHIQKWYRPDHVEATVIGGDLLIWLAIIGMCFVGALPWSVPAYYISLHIVAGIPIVAWQREKRNQRKRNQEEIKRRLEARQ